MMQVGVSVVDVTPRSGLAMAGFAVRHTPATGTHDPLTARALVVDDTALVMVDLIGIDAGLSARVRDRCPLPAGNVTIAATHTHGGPASMPGRLAIKADPAYMDRLESGILRAIGDAWKTRQPASLRGGTGAEPGFASNRRHDKGPVDKGVPVLRFDRMDGTALAYLVSHACHPVVLGADNLRWTADYPHFVRARIESRHPEAVALFATGCAGDVNTGHSAAASLSSHAQINRTFARAREIGDGVARAALSADLRPLSGPCSAAEARATLYFALREKGAPQDLALAWRAAAQSPGDIHAIWADWATTQMGRDLDPLPARCTALNWAGAQIVGLPGEIFARTALDLRSALQGQAPLHVIAYADDNPGYIPPREEYGVGGYEVDEAHRFYGLGASMAPGVAEALSRTAQRAAETAAQATAEGCSPKNNKPTSKENRHEMEAHDTRTGDDHRPVRRADGDRHNVGSG